MIKVAVLMTCFNRQETTLAAIAGLEAQLLPAAVELEIFLTDDGSSDGTSEAVRLQHPAVRLLTGDGSLFWTGGTLRSEHAALAGDPDFLLWLNDDVALEATAIADMLGIASPGTVVVGAVSLPGGSTSSYGGYRRAQPHRRFPLSKVEPDGHPQQVETMNGNVVLIPKRVRRDLGGLDPRLRHNMADMDFGFRCADSGVPVILTPRFVGTCSENPGKHPWSDPRTPLAARWKAVLSVKGLPPGQWLIFTRRHLGWRWPRYFAGPYIRTLLVGILGRARGWRA